MGADPRYVAGKKLATIVRALYVVQARYDLTRKARAAKVGAPAPSDGRRLIQHGGGRFMATPTERDTCQHFPSIRLASAWPAMSDDAQGDLAADIRAHGQLEAATISPEGELLDGRNRMAACEIVGVELKHFCL